MYGAANIITFVKYRSYLHSGQLNLKSLLTMALSTYRRATKQPKYAVVFWCEERQGGYLDLKNVISPKPLIEIGNIVQARYQGNVYDVELIQFSGWYKSSL